MLLLQISNEIGEHRLLPKALLFKEDQGLIVSKKSLGQF